MQLLLYHSRPAALGESCAQLRKAAHSCRGRRGSTADMHGVTMHTRCRLYLMTCLAAMHLREAVGVSHSVSSPASCRRVESRSLLLWQGTCTVSPCTCAAG